MGSTIVFFIAIPVSKSPDTVKKVVHAYSSTTFMVTEYASIRVSENDEGLQEKTAKRTGNLRNDLQKMQVEMFMPGDLNFCVFQECEDDFFDFQI